ncbi:MAG: hypothetical protein JWN34_4180 [Bryobacterales bacterium]|nr:hypothetical protein [Bryobacterales bacterium]
MSKSHTLSTSLLHALTVSMSAIIGTSLLFIPGAMHAQAPPRGSGNVEYRGFVRVIDGGTFEMYLKGNQVGVGAIGIKAPEGNTPCGKLAAKLPQVLLPFRASLEEDPKITFDARGRRMYYLLTSDGRSVAQELVKAGLAVPDGTGKEAAKLIGLSKQASTGGLGCVSGRPSEATLRNAETLLSPAAVAAGSPRVNANLLPRAAASSAILSSGFTETVVAGGFTFPTEFAFLPDGRSLIVEKAGIVRVFKNGTVLSTPLLDLTSVVNDYWDRGLIGLAVDPNFASNGYIYLAYTYENDAADYSGPKTGRVSRFTVVGDTAIRASETVILGTTVGSSCDNFPAGTDCIVSDFASHSVGALKFDGAGNLMVTLGEGSSFNVVTPQAFRAQNLDSLGGKLLRITTTGLGVAGNPFWNGSATANRSKVWAYGFRNPYRMSVRPTGNIPYVGDVGWYTWEEVNVATAGANLGWPCYEGVGQQPGYAPDPACQALYSQGAGASKAPLYTYNHNGASSAVTGGVFYTGLNYPAQFQGAYFFGDYAQAIIRYLKVDAANNLVSGPTDFLFNGDGPVSINQGPDGNLYYLAIVKGELRRINYVGGTPPPLTVVSLNPASGAQGVSVSAAIQATFSSLLDPASVNTTTFSLKQQATPIAGSVTYNGGGPTASFTPNVSLQPGVSYTATVKGGSGGVRDISGNPLAADVTWTFTVVAVAPPPSGTSYVSDLNATSTVNGWGPVEKDMSNGENAAGDGRPLTIRGTVFAKGLGTHAGSDVRYNLGGACSLFSATIGTDDESTSGPSSVVFQVWGDGVKLYDSGTMLNTTAPIVANVNLAGKSQLQLVVTDAGDGTTSDHADWANARITCGGASGPVVTSTSPASGATGVALNGTITATFGSAVDPTSVTPATFTVVRQGTTGALPSTVSYNNSTLTASLQPGAALQPSATYIVTLKGGSAGVKDTQGTPLAADQTWSFTTSGGQGYVSDLTWTSMINGWGPAERDQSNGESSPGDGRPLSIRGTTFTKGLGVHAASDIRYAIGGSCSGFSAVVGIDDEVAAGFGSVIFQVWGDGNKLFESGLLTRASPALPINVNTTGRNQLQLVVTDGGDGVSYDHADWADAKLNCTSSGAPVPTITSPSSSFLWKVGDVINYSGSALDAAGAAIPAANLSWSIILHHCAELNCHTHPFTSSTGATGSFTAPDHADSTYFELVLTAVDSAGRSGTTSLSIQPVTVTLNFASTPSGLQLLYNGGTLTTPTSVQTIVGSAHTISATTPQSGVTFSGWSDGGAQQHNIVAPATTATYTAYFDVQISAVAASTIGASGATITWATDQQSDSQVEYGTTTAYGASTALAPGLVTSHSVGLTGLAPNTLYHYRVKSKNASGRLTTSGDFTFTTASTGGPVISAVTASSITNTGATIAWTTDQASDTQVEYGTTTAYGSASTLVATQVTSHSVAVSGLTAATLYHYRVKSKNAGGQLSTSADFTFTTTGAGTPVISAVTATGITATGATVTWTTSQASDSQVEYGTTTAYGSSTTLVTTAVTNHSVALTGLTGATLYHYRVKSKNSAGQLAASGDFTFTTTGSSGPPAGVNFLSNLTWTSATNGYGPAELDKSNGENAAGDGGAISIRGTTYAKGLGTHAASDIRYNVANACSVFSAVLGVDDEVSAGSVVFQVWGDGTKRYDSGILARASAPVSASVNIDGVTQLQLVVTDAGDGIDSDHADWANATVNCTSGPAVASTTPGSGAAGVPLNTAVTASFVSAVDAATVTPATLTLVRQGTTTLLGGTVTWDATKNTAKLQPTAALLAGVTYVATVKGGASGVKDTAGNAMVADQTWTFTTVTGAPTGTNFLSDLTWLSAVNGWGPVERDTSNGENVAGDGGPITLRGATFAKGLGAHAASDVRYNLGGACSAFTATVGVDDESAVGFGSVVFQVWTDGTKLYDSGLLTRASAAANVNVNITGKSQLQLVITDGGDGAGYDHADWANAKIICQ